MRWNRQTITHMTTSNDTQIVVVRQVGGNDCGVFLCMFVDVIARGISITEVDKGCVEIAR